MIKTHEEAIKAIEEFDHLLWEMDTAFCRNGGHPDVAMWIKDRPLHDCLVRVQEDLNDLAHRLKEKEKKHDVVE